MVILFTGRSRYVSVRFFNRLFVEELDDVGFVFSSLVVFLVDVILLMGMNLLVGGILEKEEDGVVAGYREKRLSIGGSVEGFLVG